MPVLLRIADPEGRFFSEIEIDTTWSPSGRRFVERQRTAAGLCVIPWLGTEEGVLVELRAGPAAERLRVERNRHDRERALEVRLQR